jgi:predicted phage-related endonuclease
MTTTPPSVQVPIPPESRLEQLLAIYEDLKPKADEINNRLKIITDSIKAELITAAPLAQRIDIAGHPLYMVWMERWSLDTKRMKIEIPELYAAYARKSSTWYLKRSY